MVFIRVRRTRLTAVSRREDEREIERTAIKTAASTIIRFAYARRKKTVLDYRRVVTFGFPSDKQIFGGPI
jgi:hypothetical protein